MSPWLLDTDTLSEVMKGRDPWVAQRALDYLVTHGAFTFSIITRYEVSRGLRAKEATRQLQTFEARCRQSDVLPLTAEIVEEAAVIYGYLYRRGDLISDADILIAATALVNRMTLVTGNVDHFRRIAGLTIESWRRSTP